MNKNATKSILTESYFLQNIFFECPCKRTVTAMHFIFNKKHPTGDIPITCINFVVIEEYLQKLEHWQIDRQTNGCHKHFSKMEESAKNDIEKKSTITSKML